MAHLQIGNPHELFCPMLIKGDIEGALHDRLWRHQKQGEWYDIHGIVSTFKKATLPTILMNTVTRIDKGAERFGDSELSSMHTVDSDVALDDLGIRPLGAGEDE